MKISYLSSFKSVGVVKIHNIKKIPFHFFMTNTFSIRQIEKIAVIKMF